MFTRLVVVATVLLSSLSVRAAQSGHQNFVYGTFNFHFENRVLVTNVNRTNTDYYLGFDRLLNPEGGLYIGARLGLYNEEVLTSLPVSGIYNHFFFGAQGFKLFKVADRFGIKLGVALDLLAAVASTPLSLYIGGLSGLRLDITDNIYVDVPVEIGVWPFYSGVGLFTRVGLQVGVGF